MLFIWIQLSIKLRVTPENSEAVSGSSSALSSFFLPFWTSLDTFKQPGGTFSLPQPSQEPHTPRRGLAGHFSTGQIWWRLSLYKYAVIPDKSIALGRSCRTQVLADPLRDIRLMQKNTQIYLFSHWLGHSKILETTESLNINELRDIRYLYEFNYSRHYLELGR